MLAVWHGDLFLDEVAREINHARGRLPGVVVAKSMRMRGEPFQSKKD